MKASLKLLYSKDFLLKELWPCATRSDPKDFAVFHAKTVKAVFPDLEFDFLAINRIHLNAKGVLDIGSVYDCPQKIIASCERTLHHDLFLPVVPNHCGAAPNSGEVESTEQCDETPFFKSHCHIFDTQHAIGMAYQFPHHKLSFLTFYYMCSPNTQCATDVNKKWVEYVSLPFCLAWMHLHDRICAQTLKDYLSRLIGKTPERLQVLREIASSPAFNAKNAANQLGVSVHTIYKHVSEAHQELLCHDSLDKRLFTDGNSNRIHLLAHQYRFLSWAGRGV